MNLANKTVVKSLPIDSDEYSMVQNLCDYGTNIRPIDSKPEMNESKAAGKWEPFRDLIIKVAKPCRRLLIWCSYGGIEYNCSEIFITVLSDDGLCCSFNALNRRFIEKIQYGTH